MKYVKIEEVAEISRGVTWKSKDEFNEPTESTIRVYKIPHIQLINKYQLNSNPIYIKKPQKYDRYILKNEDIIMVGSNGNPDRIGNVVMYNGYEEALFASFLLRLRARKNICPEFLYYQISGPFIQKSISNDSAGSTGLRNINATLMREMDLLLFPLKEQQKIAAILSSVDEVIEKTEAIIEQTETVKIGVMQELFFKGAGHKQFKKTQIGDIPLSWETVQTGDLFENKSVKKHENLEVLTVTQDRGVVLRKDFDMNIKYDKSSLKNYKKVDCGDFIISLRSFQGGLEMSTFEGIVSPAYTVLNYKKEIDENYFKYFFKSFWFIEQLKASTIGIRDGKQISYQDFKLIRIPLPSLEEQRKISNTIEQIEEKVNFEYERLVELSNVKQGLMQQLLTGKIRVPVDDSEGGLS